MKPRPDDPRGTEQQLRELLENAVHDVEPRPGLDAIQSRTKVTPMSSARPWIFGVGGAVVATAATIVAFTVLADDTRTTSGPSPAEQPSATAESPTITDKGTPSEEPSETTTPPAESAVPVYYVGDTPMGARLYREFHAPTDGPAAQDAVRQAMATAPNDPDYRSPWPSGTGATVDVTEDLITIDIDAPAALHDRPSGMTQDEAEMAVQQLVYTVTAATQSTPGVQFLLNGDRTDQLLGVPVSEPLARGDELSTLAMVWIIDPREGSTVDGAFTVSGIGAFHEATVLWELRDGDTVVEEGHAMSEEAFTMAPYSFKVPAVEPGTYTLVVAQSDPSGGAEGSGPMQDTKTITVR